MTSLPRLYRSVLREFTQNSIHPRGKRSPSIAQHLRVYFDGIRGVDAKSEDATRLRRTVEDMVVFMRSHRLHKELVERYNPVSKLSQEERAAATANRVGLNMPKEYEDQQQEQQAFASVDHESLRKGQA